MHHLPPHTPWRASPLFGAFGALAAFVALAAASVCGAASAAVARPAQSQPHQVSPLRAEDFVDLLRNDLTLRRAAASRIEQQWQANFVPMLLEVLQLVRDRPYREQLFGLLERATGQKQLGTSGNDWFEWYWAQEERQPWQHYADFKSALYRLIDPRFAAYFAHDRPTTIALDEVRWGGVAQDGIPPLRQPKMIPAGDALFLAPKDVVFGLEINGDARAYPKRIMGWHEMFVDTVGGVEVAGVYCTLCGSMVLFETEVGGVRHELGTSGFLFRSNKLMYDQATQSLWNTLWGTPVIGPLVGQGIELPRRSIVTTRWSDWLARHPDTKVLSTDTGFERDYSEGAAYREYFATDELMFSVSQRDERLKNKDEVLCLLVGEQSSSPVAIAVKFLRRKPVYQLSESGTELVVLTDRSGASRVFAAAGRRFDKWDQKGDIKDNGGIRFEVTEQALVGEDGTRLERFPSHRAFWFGWYAAYPETKLIR